MRSVCHSICLLLVLPLLLGGCGKDGTGGGEEPRPPVGGEVTLRLRVPSGESGLRWDWTGEERALVNGVACTVGFDAGGVPVVGTDASSDGLYTVYFPADAYSRVKRAFILPPAQFPASGGSLQAAACPMYGTVRTADGVGEVTLSPLCGVVRIVLAGDARIASVRVEDKAAGTVSGLFPFDPAVLKLTQDSDPGNLPWVVLDCAGTGGGVSLAASGKEFCVAVPEGNYASGLRIRVTDCGHRSATYDIPGPCAVTAGGVKNLAPLDYAPDAGLLFAEHFDNCVWGCDYVGEKSGYGVGAGSSVPSPATSAGTEAAYVAKGVGTPGSVLFETSDYNSAPAASSTLAVRRDYLRNRGLYDWQRLFYASEYRGSLCGGDVGNYGNRGILVTPPMTNADESCYAELSFRICLERGMASDVACLAESGVLLGCTIDGEPVDTDVTTGTDISQSVQGVTRTAVVLRTAKLAHGVWHEVRMSFGAVAGGSAFRFMPTVIRNAANCFWIDDVVVRRTAPYAHSGDYVTVEPTTERGVAGEDVSRLRLRPSAVLSMANETTYTTTPGYGMTWICPSLSSDESVWAQDIAFAQKQLAANGCKVWCIHLPYGSTTAVRNRDLCAAGADRTASVAFFTKAIRAVAPLGPKNVLVHCNQTLAFGDGSSAASLALSLHELQTVADEIGAHVCVENMSYGVGADAAVLAAAVDEANAMGSHRHEVRIAFDTGHANLYLTREQPGKTVLDWLRTAGARIGQLHVHGNRGWTGRINDDHLMPGYAGRLGYSDAIGKAGLWGEFYRVLLAECRYRGPFTYEISTRSFGAVAGEERYDNVSAPWTIAHNYDTYMYPAFRGYGNRK